MSLLLKTFKGAIFYLSLDCEQQDLYLKSLQLPGYYHELIFQFNDGLSTDFSPQLRDEVGEGIFNIAMEIKGLVDRLTLNNNIKWGKEICETREWNEIRILSCLIIESM